MNKKGRDFVIATNAFSHCIQAIKAEEIKSTKLKKQCYYYIWALTLKA